MSDLTSRFSVRRMFVPLLAATALLASACSVSWGSGSSADTASGGTTTTLQQTTSSSSGDPVVAAIADVAPAVVTITNHMAPEQSPFGITSSGVGTGTGFIVRSDGVIVTNDHVVEGAQKLTRHDAGSRRAHARRDRHHHRPAARPRGDQGRRDRAADGRARQLERPAARPAGRGARLRAGAQGRTHRHVGHRELARPHDPGAGPERARRAAGPTTTSCRPTPPSTPATPAAR